MKLSDLKAAALVLVFIIAMGFQNNPQQQPKTVTLVLSIEHAETVMKALSKLPYEESAPIIATIQDQAMRQLQPPAKTDSTKPKKQIP